MAGRRPEVDDAPTEPLRILLDARPRHRDSSSRASQVIAALAPTPRARHRRPPQRLRLGLIVLLVAAVTTSLAIVLRPGGPLLGVHDTALHTRSGDCLTWPDGIPDRAAAVDCVDDHLFEVTESVDIDGISDQPGVDTARQVEQTFDDVCPGAASRYLNGRLDPGGRFVVGMLWSPSGPQPQAGGRLVCGLQLRSDGNASKPIRGRIADQDQSNVWPSGTCLGIEDGRATDIPVDCGAAHAMEVIGTANLDDAFDDEPPPVAAQDTVVRDICSTKATDYLAPRSLPETTLTLHYTPISPAGWGAGSRWIACRLASLKPDGSWAQLVGSARSGILIDGVAPAPVVAAEPTEVAPETITNAGATIPPEALPPLVEPAAPDLAIPNEEPVPAVLAEESSPAAPSESPPRGPLPGPPPELQVG